MATVIDLLRHLGQHAAPNGDNALAGPVMLPGVTDATLALPLAPTLVNAWSNMAGRPTLGHHALALSAAQAGENVALMGHGTAPHLDLVLLSFSRLRYEHTTLWIIPEEASELRAKVAALADQLRLRWIDAGQARQRAVDATLVIATPRELHSRILRFHDRAWRWLWPRLTAIAVPELQRFTTIRAGHLRWLLRRAERLAAHPTQILGALASITDADGTLQRLFGRSVRVIAAPTGPSHSTLAALWRSGPDRQATTLKLARELRARRLVVAVLGRSREETAQLQAAFDADGPGGEQARVAIVSGIPETVAERQALLRSGYRLMLLLAADEPHELLLQAQPDLLLQALPQWPIATANMYIAADQLACAAAERPVSEQEIDEWHMRELRDRLLRRGVLSPLPSGDHWQGAPAANDPYENVHPDALGEPASIVYDPAGTAIGTIPPALLDRVALPGQAYRPGLRVAARDDAAHTVRLAPDPTPRVTVVLAEVDVDVREELAARSVHLGKQSAELTRGKVLATQRVTGMEEHSATGRVTRSLDTPAELQWSAAACWLALPGAAVVGPTLGWAVQQVVPLMLLATPAMLAVTVDAALQRIYLVETEPGGVGVIESIYDRFERLIELASELAIAGASSPLYREIAAAERAWLGPLQGKPLVVPQPKAVAAQPERSPVAAPQVAAAQTTAAKRPEPAPVPRTQPAATQSPGGASNPPARPAEVRSAPAPRPTPAQPPLERAAATAPQSAGTTQPAPRPPRGTGAAVNQPAAQPRPAPAPAPRVEPGSRPQLAGATQPVNTPTSSAAPPRRAEIVDVPTVQRDVAQPPAAPVAPARQPVVEQRPPAAAPEPQVAQAAAAIPEAAAVAPPATESAAPEPTLAQPERAAEPEPHAEPAAVEPAPRVTIEPEPAQRETLAPVPATTAAEPPAETEAEQPVEAASGEAAVEPIVAEPSRAPDSAAAPVEAEPAPKIATAQPEADEPRQDALLPTDTVEATVTPEVEASTAASEAQPAFVADVAPETPAADADAAPAQPATSGAEHDRFSSGTTTRRSAPPVGTPDREADEWVVLAADPNDDESTIDWLADAPRHAAIYDLAQPAAVPEGATATEEITAEPDIAASALEDEPATPEPVAAVEPEFVADDADRTVEPQPAPPAEAADASSAPEQAAAEIPTATWRRRATPAHYLIDDVLPSLDEPVAEPDAAAAESTEQFAAEQAPDSTPEVEEAGAEPERTDEAVPPRATITELRPPPRAPRPPDTQPREARPPLPFRRPEPTTRSLWDDDADSEPAQPAAEQPAAPPDEQRAAAAEEARRFGTTGAVRPPGRSVRDTSPARDRAAPERNPARETPPPPPTPERPPQRDDQSRRDRQPPQRDERRPAARKPEAAPEPAANVGDMIARMRRLREQREAEQAPRRAEPAKPAASAPADELRFHIGDRVQCLPYGNGVVRASRLAEGRELLQIDFPDYGEIEVDPAISLVRQLPPEQRPTTEWSDDLL